MDLGAASIELTDTGACFVPRRMQRSRGARRVTIAYPDIEGLSMTEPEGLARGRLTVRVSGGEDLSMSFGPFRRRDMQRVYAEMWARSRAARQNGPAPH